MEDDVAVRGIVLHLLDQVTAVVNERKSRPTTATSGELEPAAMVRNELPENIITNFSIKSSRVEVIQLKCVVQRASGHCGHYALFFALVMMEAFNMHRSQDELKSLISVTADPVAFWKRYWRTVSVLLNEASLSGNGWWPWTKEHIIGGDMERSFLSFILVTDSDVTTLNTNDNIHVLHFAYGLLQNNEDEICAVQKRILKLRQSVEDHLVFVLGVTNHWVTLAVKKRKESLCTFYLDSNNEPVLMAPGNMLERLVEIREEKYTKRKGQPYSDWKRKVLYQSFVDQRDLVDLLLKCVSGEKDLREELTIQNWTKLIDSFCQVVNGDKDSHLAGLITWLQEHYPSSVLMSHHVEMLSQFHKHLNKDILLHIKKWAEDCSQHAEEKQSGLENVEAFYSIVEKVLTIVNKEQ